MLHSGSMSFALSVEAELELKTAGILLNFQPLPGKVVLVGCGGLVTTPGRVYNLCVEIYGLKFTVPTFLVPGQRDEFIIGCNDIMIGSNVNTAVEV